MSGASSNSNYLIYMNDALCLQLPITGTFDDVPKDYVMGKFFLYNLPMWNKPRFEESLHASDIVKACNDLVRSGQFQKATDFMLNEMCEHTKVLARIFGKTVNDSSDISALFDTLMLEDNLGKEDRNRLNILQMAIDGIDVEVQEYGKVLQIDETGYLAEFLEIIDRLLLSKRVSVGFAVYQAGQYLIGNFGVYNQTVNVTVPDIHTSSTNPNYLCAGVWAGTTVWVNLSQANQTVTIVQSS